MLLGKAGLRASVLSVILFSPVPSAPWLATVTLLAGATVATVPSVAEARPRARSSGGYARPGRSSVRTPSFGGGWGAPAPRTPSTSGGYSRPSGSSLGYGRPTASSPSAADRAFSRQRS